MLHKIVFTGVNTVIILNSIKFPRRGHRKFGTKLTKFALKQIQTCAEPQDFKKMLARPVA